MSKQIISEEFKRMQYLAGLITETQQHNESLATKVASVALAAAALGSSCKKDSSVELNLTFDITSAKITNAQNPDAQKDYIGDKAYYVTKQDRITGREVSPQWTLCEEPTPEQLAVVISYKTKKSEERINQNLDSNSVKILDLNNVRIQTTQTTNSAENTKLTDASYYKEAWEWCNDNKAIFQNDLDNLKKSTNKKEPFNTLKNFNAAAILIGNKPT
jgi:hypothetical protein